MSNGQTQVTDRKVWAFRKLKRYTVAAIGPISSAAAHFSLSLIVLRLSSPTEFGTFTFLFVASQLSWSIWSALFCAPLPAVVQSLPLPDRISTESMFIVTSLMASIFSLIGFFGLCIFLKLDVIFACLFALYSMLALLRWFGRAFFYACGNQFRTMLSDLLYSLTIIVALTVCVLAFDLKIQAACYTSLLVAALIGLIPFGRVFLYRHIAAIYQINLLQSYMSVWQKHSRWALLGVVTTEATANAHVYLVTLMKGPSAFAPIAASALLMRPVNVAQNALSEFERPQIAALVAGGNAPGIKQSIIAFRIALGLIWLGCVSLSFLLFLTNPRILFPAAYHIDEVAITTALWGIFAALRFLQTPESTMLQAAGAFRPLALASVWSSITSVGLVFALLVTAGVLFSTGGLIAGALVYLYLTYTCASHWFENFSTSAHLQRGSRSA